MIRFPVSITFDSDWIIGTGYSRSKRVDEAVLRDSHGLPYVPAKTLAGLLRHRAEQVADALDDGSTTVWREWHAFVFGTEPNKKVAGHHRDKPTPAALYPEPLTMAATFLSARENGLFGRMSDDEIASASTVVRAAVAVDRETLAARSDTVRFEERARAGTVLSATWELDVPDKDSWPARLLLAAGARLVTAVGGNRRRGAGEASLQLWNVSDDELSDLLDAAYSPDGSIPRPPERPSTQPAELADDTLSPGQTKSRRFYDLVIRLTQPTLVNARTTANVVDSDYVIPGSVLLPIVLGLLKSGSAQAVRDAKLHISDATVSIEGQRSSPWPQSLGIDKTIDSSIATNVARSHRSNPKDKPLSSTYVTFNHDGTLTTTRLDLTQRLHAVVGDETQGPENLFVTNAIPAGIVLRAELALDDDLSLVDVVTEERHVRLGRSSKDDYGSASLSVAPHTATGPTHTTPAPGEEVMVYLESDTILIGTHGSYEPTSQRLVDELNARLPNSVFALADATPNGSDGTTSFPQCVNVIRIDGWQTKWSLPRPTVLGLAAGSVVAVKADRALTESEMELLNRAPYGLRTVEGKGRVRVGISLLQSSTTSCTKIEPVRAQLRPRDFEVAAADFIETLIDSALRARTQASAVARALEETVRRTYIPTGLSSSQLGVLRGIVEQLHTDQGHAAAERWLRKQRDDRNSPWRGTTDSLSTLFVRPKIDEFAPIWTLLFSDEIPVDDGTRLAHQQMSAVQEFMTHAIRYEMSAQEARR